ncbi:melatonin receptor type 1A-like [Actinia tenebrosa]|uniref:Melatonin receptor type 1A-like n=1 Tax=Actinia tenebrosa TaxID=6105 RepID=A0A6P8H0U0_ACTTE|nr:melatonin receptor type 1A-like [Actinia tenebrosa]
MPLDDIQKHIDRLQQELEDRSLSTTIVESGILTIIMLVTLLGNVLVCRAVYQSPRLRTITNYSVVVLALTDISMAVFVGPFTLSVFILGKKPFSHVLCQFQAYAAIALVYNSIFTVTFMSVNRYLKIVIGDHLYRKVFTHKRTVLMLFAELILGWVIPTFSLLTGREFHYHPGKMVCTMKNDPKRQSVFARSIMHGFIFFLPYCITIFCYCSIYIKVRSHNKRIANAAPSTTNNTTTTTINRKDINITKTLFAIFLVFTFCTMQLGVISYCETHIGEYKLPRQVYVLYTLMCSLASAVNPFIYGLFSPAFRSELKRSLCLTCLTNRGEAGNVIENKS